MEQLIVIAAAILLGALALALLIRLTEDADHARALEDFRRELNDPMED